MAPMATRSQLKGWHGAMIAAGATIVLLLLMWGFKEAVPLLDGGFHRDGVQRAQNEVAAVKQKVRLQEPRSEVLASYGSPSETGSNFDTFYDADFAILIGYDEANLVNQIAVCSREVKRAVYWLMLFDGSEHSSYGEAQVFVDNYYGK